MTSPKTLLRAWDIPAKKQFGQNFLTDPSAAERIVAGAKPQPEEVILEIGAGLGALTIPAARRVHHLYAVEKDERILSLLHNEIAVQGIENITVVHRDIFDVDFHEFAKRAGCKLLVIGNLPYNISSQVIVKLIEERSAVKKAVLMLQEEFAERITAQPGGRIYGRLTVALNYCADVKKLLSLKAGQFFPRPKIDSQVLEIRFKDEIPFPAADEKFLFRIIRAAFSKRRKTLRNALAGSEFHIDAQTAAEILHRADIDPSRRAETLDIEEFVRLSDTAYALIMS